MRIGEIAILLCIYALVIMTHEKDMELFEMRCERYDAVARLKYKER